VTGIREIPPRKEKKANYCRRRQRILFNSAPMVRWRMFLLVVEWATVLVLSTQQCCHMWGFSFALYSKSCVLNLVVKRISRGA
jgi:hypothetical protein